MRKVSSFVTELATTANAADLSSPSPVSTLKYKSSSSHSRLPPTTSSPSSPVAKRSRRRTTAAQSNTRVRVPKRLNPSNSASASRKLNSSARATLCFDEST